MAPRSAFFIVKEAVTGEGSAYSSAERLVALAISDHMDAKGISWPSNAVLKAWTGLGETTVRGALRVLCDGPKALFARTPPSAWRMSYTYKLLDEVRQTNPTTTDEVRETNPTSTDGVRQTKGRGSLGEGVGSATRRDGVRHTTTEVPIEPPNEPPNEVETRSVALDFNGHGHGERIEGNGKTPLERVFVAWTRLPGKSDEELTEKRKAILRAALRNYTETKLLDAMAGAVMLPEELQGHDRDRHDELADILRYGDKVERLSTWARNRREDAQAVSKREAMG